MCTEHGPLVTVIVPVYNVETYLKQCVDSIRNQTVRELEIILVDDGSPDGCPQMCDQFAAEDKRIKVIHQTNAGVSAARNRGMELASADWLMFVDSDDWLDSWAVEALYDQAIEGGFDIVCASERVDGSKWEKGCSSRRTYSLPTDLELLSSGTLGCNREMSILVSPWAKLYRKSCVAGRCRFPEGMWRWEDSIFNLYMIHASKTVCILDVKIYNYRVRAGSASRTVFPNYQDACRRYCTELQTFLETFHLEERFHMLFCQAVVGGVYGLVRVYCIDVTHPSIFMERVQLLRCICQETVQSETIDFACVSTMPTMKQKMFLWLLKRRRYGVLLFICLIYHQIVSKLVNNN